MKRVRCVTYMNGKRVEGLDVRLKGKRLRHGATRKCAVYKTGLCIDLGYNVWSSVFNRQPKSLFSRGTYVHIGRNMERESREFANHAAVLLHKYGNKLPIKHRCSNNRNVYIRNRAMKG